MEPGKTQKRLGLIIQSVALNISAPLFSLFISWMVIHMQNAHLWGEFIRVQVWVMIAVQVFAFGNKDYLLRAFNKNPSRIDYNWSRSFFSRAILLLACGIVFVSSSLSLPYKGWILTWVVFRFVYQSFDVLVLYNRKFYLSIAAETIGLLLLFVALVKPIAQPALGHLLKVYVIADILKAVFIVLFFQNSFTGSFFHRFNLGYFKGAFMFFLIGITGLVSARADLLCVNSFMASAAIAKYQVFTSLIGFMQLGASLIVSPFIKNIYRFNRRQLKKIAARYSRAGILLSMIQTLAVFVITAEVFHFSLSPVMYLFSYLYILAFYFYYIRMIEFTKINRQHIIVLILFLCSAVNILTAILLIPEFKLEGALFSGMLAQWLIFFSFRFMTRTKQLESPLNG